MSVFLIIWYSPDSVDNYREECFLSPYVNAAILQEIHQRINDVILSKNSLQLWNIFDLENSGDHSDTFDEGGESCVFFEWAQDLLVLLNQNVNLQLSFVDWRLVQHLEIFWYKKFKQI